MHKNVTLKLPKGVKNITIVFEEETEGSMTEEEIREYFSQKETDPDEEVLYMNMFDELY